MKRDSELRYSHDSIASNDGSSRELAVATKSSSYDRDVTHTTHVELPCHCCFVAGEARAGETASEQASRE